MAIGKPGRKRAPLGVFLMLAALVVAAFIGATAGLVWQSSGWFDEDDPREVVTVEAPGE